MSRVFELFATCPKGVEDLLAAECRQQTLSAVRCASGGVVCEGTLEQAYRLCLWSRVASRVLLKLHAFAVSDHEDLYRGVQAVAWDRHLDSDGSLAIDTHTAHRVINNSHYATLKIKDAIVDQFKHAYGRRPDIERNRPDMRINAYIDAQACTIYLDLAGEPLHMRGYRQRTGAAPLKENLAAAILLRARWPEFARQGRALIDPLCGSGTLLLEAAFIAAGMAPGLERGYFGFIGWKQHDAGLWDQVQQDANRQVDKSRVPRMIGVEKSGKVADIARENIRSAGFEGLIEIRQGDTVGVITQAPAPPGLIVMNPPYGKRLGEVRELRQLYLDLGRTLKSGFPGWDVALFTANHELARLFGLRAHHRNTLYNGPLKCTLYQYRIREPRLSETRKEALTDASASGESVMFANRLSKNMKHLSRWLRRENVSCYRLYDADIPQYALAVDIYEDQVHVQEYEAPGSVDAVQAFVRLSDAMDTIARVLNVDKHRIVLKTRRKQSGSDQYARHGDAGEALIVHENALKFKVNLRDYLDTGLFLDHRLTRKLIYKLCAGKSFLNLFAYTGTATVYAAAGGARCSTTVDMSNTYLAWARDNMQLNRLSGKNHEFIQADCLQWLAEAARRRKRYEVIFLDPPTFSNSKRMSRTLDIRRDHVELITQAMALLEDDGVLLFSCNAKGFKLDEKGLEVYAMRDITRLTTDEDYRRKPAHVCWCLANEVAGLAECRI